MSDIGRRLVKSGCRKATGHQPIAPTLTGPDF